MKKLITLTFIFASLNSFASAQVICGDVAVNEHSKSIQEAANNLNKKLKYVDQEKVSGLTISSEKFLSYDSYTSVACVLKKD